MDNKNIAFFARSILALILGIQVWVWLRIYVGIFRLAHSGELIKVVVKAIAPLNTSLDAFRVLVVPTLVLSYIFHRRLSIGMRFVFYALLGTFYSTLYLIFMAKLNLEFIQQQVWVYCAIGTIAGLAYVTTLDFSWRSRTSSDDDDKPEIS